MNYDLELTIRAPVQRVFHLVRDWHTVEPLRRLAGVREYRDLGGSAAQDFYRLAVRELPLKTTYCYGKRLCKPPTTLVNMFLYRFFGSRKLESPGAIDELIEQRWDDFFYQTTRLQPLPSGRTRLYFLDSFGLDNPRKEGSFQDYFAQLQQLAETEIVSTGIDVVAEPADDAEFPEDDFGGDEGAYETEEVFTYDIYDDYNPWAMLGLNRDATIDEVKRAYRHMARQYHPDSSQATGTDYGHNQFVEITAAYHAILREME